MNDNARTPLSRLLDNLQASGTGYDIEIPEDWRQGRAIYGGLSGALCLAAIQTAYDSLPPLRSAQIAFIGPAGSQVHIRPALMRRGKSTAFLAADMTSGDETAVRATYCFGADRDSALAFDGTPAPAVADPDDSGPFFGEDHGYSAGPNFIRHFESRRAGAAAPGVASAEPEFLAWIRHRDRAIEPVMSGLVALADALPPAAIACLNTPAPVSAMTWQFDVLTDRPATRDGWWLCRARADRVGSGYAAQSMMIWNADREPVIAGRQNVAVFA